jgi:nitrogen fixation protein NifU and related proteins
MTTAVKNKNQSQARELFERFHRLVTGSPEPSDAAELGKLAAFAGVCQYPIRVKCASLGWHAMKAALDQSNATVSTE